MKKKAKRDPFTRLPEELIHHIQSFLTEKEAAQTSHLSKFWHDAWLTRPALTFDERKFKSVTQFLEIATKFMERYIAMNLTIQSFTMYTHTKVFGSRKLKLITDAVKIGATDLDIDLPSLDLPLKVLRSETLARLRLRGGVISSRKVNCPLLKSLILDEVRVKSDDRFWDIISCCSSIEELSLSNCVRTELSHMLELHKLRRLNLKGAKEFGDEFSFFSNFASRFPCLKDLSLEYSKGYKKAFEHIQIDSTSLEHISVTNHDQNMAFKAEFNVPNIRRFVYAGSSLPTLCFKACSSEWESDISVKWRPSSSTFLSLHNLLTELRASRISLTMSPYLVERDIDVAAAEPAVAVENLKIVAPSALISSSFIVGLFRVCRPSFINHTWKTRGYLLRAYDTLTTLDMSTQFDLNVEYYDMILREWWPYEFTTPPFKQKIRFHLKHKKSSILNAGGSGP